MRHPIRSDADEEALFEEVQINFVEKAIGFRFFPQKFPESQYGSLIGNGVAKAKLNKVEHPMFSRCGVASRLTNGVCNELEGTLHIRDD